MTNPNYVLTQNLMHALATHGVKHAVITPGSRNTPLAWACAMEGRVRNWIHHDERSASFFALGIAKTTHQPVVLVCTSGTAAAEYLPAITEAQLARVPLIVLTADRPHELRSVGAPQTANQSQMYGAAVGWFHEAAVPTPDVDLSRYAVSLGTQAYVRSSHTPAGPVHVNFGFRDPLSPDNVSGERSTVHPVQIPQLSPHPVDIDQIAELTSGSKALIVAGPTDLPFDSVIDFASSSGIPLLADPLSGYRGRAEADISHGDTLARIGFPELDLEPDVILQIGAPPTSKALGAYISTHPQVVIIDDGGWSDPHHVGRHVRSNPATFFAGLPGIASQAGWFTKWTEANTTVARTWDSLPFPSEPGAAALLATSLPRGSVLWAASSMPIRDLDSFFHPQHSIEVKGNRGANGIDGFVSSMLGSAAVSGRPTYALVGDLSFLYDVGALGTGRRLGINATFILINNDGGGIFSFLPQAGFPDHFESHLATPHGADLGAIAQAYGAEYHHITDADQFRSEILRTPSGIRVLEIRTDRRENLVLHQDLWDLAVQAFL